MKHTGYILSILMLLLSCESNFKPVTFETVTIENSTDADITLSFDKATGNSDLSKAINTTIEKIIVGTLNASEVEPDLNLAFAAFNSDYKTFITNFPKETNAIWALHVETEITFQSKNTISIAISTYRFKGGAHGDDSITFLNLNAKTGAVLNQNEIIKNTTDFKKLAESYFTINLEDGNEALTLEEAFYGKSFQLPENMGFSDDGLVLLYTPYEVASYHQGFVEFVIPFEEVKPFLKTY